MRGTIKPGWWSGTAGWFRAQRQFISIFTCSIAVLVALFAACGGQARSGPSSVVLVLGAVTSLVGLALLSNGAGGYARLTERKRERICHLCHYPWSTAPGIRACSECGAPYRTTKLRKAFLAHARWGVRLNWIAVAAYVLALLLNVFEGGV